MSTKKTFSTETSERYSRALFEVSKESNEIEKVEADVKIFQSIFNTNVELKNFIKDPTYSIKQQNQIIEQLAKQLNFSKNLKNFLLLLIEKRRIFFVKKVFDTFLKLCANKRGEINASLISSKELSNAELEQINKDLSETMRSALKFDYKVDKSLIGGLKLQLGSFMIDTSIKNKLKKYEQIMLED